MRINLGDMVRDNITGFEGVVVTVCCHLHCVEQVAVQSASLYNERPQKVQWFDAPRLEIVDPR